MEAYALTDTGRVRYMNQDYIYSSPEKVGSLPNLFLVADGMGGHKAGDYASRYTVENLVVYLNGQGQGSPVMQLKTGIQAVNERLYEESRSREELRGHGMHPGGGCGRGGHPLCGQCGRQPALPHPPGFHPPDHPGSLLCGGDGGHGTDGPGQRLLQEPQEYHHPGHGN